MAVHAKILNCVGRIMDLVTEKAQHFTDSDSACIELIEETNLVYSTVSGIVENFLGLRLRMEDSLSGASVRERGPMVCNDIEGDGHVNREA